MLKSNYAPGFYANLSNEAYHADPSISSSGLKMFAEMPKLFYLNYLDENSPERKRTKAMNKGSRLHTALLEPDFYGERYKVAPPTCINDKGKTVPFTRIQKKAWKEFEEMAESEGKEAITHDDKIQDFAVVEAITGDPFAKKIFSIRGAVEGSFFSKCADTGLPIRARPDMLVELPGGHGFDGGLYIIDLKTTAQDLSDSSQIRIAMGSDKRHIQASFHTTTVEQELNTKIQGTLHFVCDMSFPFFYRCLQLQPDQMQQGHDEKQALMVKLDRCFQANTWPGYKQGVDYYIDTPEYLTYPRHYALQIEI